ncbi:MAG: TMEM165/GDT1 family protein [Deltaproteobacteria bacterium]|nr:TMEM165/GDT1 family protein [Deltaproteobacteria bacterium]MBW2100070.1 TMEM165/GDT1 family protein [Deltaproteobacteria bacterium]
MDFKLMLTTFALVFMAELGDKTQLAVFCLSAENNSKVSLFIGSVCALSLSSLLAVVFGDAISRVLPANYIKIGAGTFFILVGVWTLLSANRL